MGKNGIHLNNIISILKEVEIKEGNIKSKIRNNISEQSFNIITKFLLKKEFIKYETNKKDKRVKLIYLTDKGKTFLNLF
jgi:DNA-binding MarR family transcriptional regulator